MINSAKNTFESIDANFHGYATSLIIFDRTLRSYGDATQDTRSRLLAYLERAIETPYRGDEALQHRNSEAAKYLDDIGKSLTGIKPPDRFHETMFRISVSNTVRSSSSAGESSSNRRGRFRAH